MHRWIQFTLGLALAVSALVPAAVAQDTSLAAPVFVYEAKVVCKNVFSSNPTDLSFDFGPHFFRTVLNVHNRADSAARIRIQAIEAVNIGSGRVGASGETTVVARPNQAVFVNCGDVRRLLAREDRTLRVDGYIRLESSAPLTVDGVYNALTRRADGRTEDTSLDVERIRGRLLRPDNGSDLEPIDAP